MDITITIANSKTELLKSALKYKDQIEDEETDEMIPNPQTPKQFLKEYIEKHLKMKVKSYIGQEASRTSDYTLE